MYRVWVITQGSILLQRMKENFNSKIRIGNNERP